MMEDDEECNCDPAVEEPNRYIGCPVHGHLFKNEKDFDRRDEFSTITEKPIGFHVHFENRTVTPVYPRPGTKIMSAVEKIVDEQANDSGLWFAAKTASEAYLQQELRRLHEAIEGKSATQCGLEALEQMLENVGTTAQMPTVCTCPDSGCPAHDPAMIAYGDAANIADCNRVCHSKTDFDRGWDHACITIARAIRKRLAVETKGSLK